MPATNASGMTNHWNFQLGCLQEGQRLPMNVCGYSLWQPVQGLVTGVNILVAFANIDFPLVYRLNKQLTVSIDE